MGVSGLARTVLGQYKDENVYYILNNNDKPTDINLNKVDIKIKYLYIDFNSIIYKEYNNIINSDNFNPDEIKTKNSFEKILIDRVITNLKKTINIINPSVKVFIAPDGPAPVSKMIQQRLRRYLNLLNINDDKVIYWDTRNITPGTAFMYKLNYRLRQEVVNKTLYNKSGVELVLSDSSISGEGEHKIMDDIRSIKDIDDICIISVDADLIILSSMYMDKQMYIVTIPPNNVVEDIGGDYDKFIYIYMNNFHKGYFTEMKNMFLDFINGDFTSKNYIIRNNINNFIEDVTLNIDLDDKEVQQRIMKDFIFYTMLAGNDFVKALPKLEMRRSGFTFDLLAIIYMSTLNKYAKFLVNKDDSINTKFLIEIIRKISTLEHTILSNYDYRITNYKSRRDEDKEILMEHTLYYDKDVMDKDKYKEFMDIHKELKVTNDNTYKINYYKRYFKDVVYKDKIVKSQMNYICKEYIKSLLFTYQYYIGRGSSDSGPPSWRWYYPFDTSPYTTDLYHSIKYINDINYLGVFEKLTPITPLQQLMVVMPRNSSTLPSCYRDEMRKEENASLFPIEFTLDLYLGEKDIYAEPFLPELNLEKVIELSNNCNGTLTKNQKLLNKINTNVYCTLV